MYFNQEGDITTLNGNFVKLVDKFMYLSSSVLSTESDINMHRVKAWTAIDSLSIIWKSDKSDKIKRNFFQAVVVLILLYRCTTWMLTKCWEEKLDRNCTRMLQAIFEQILEATSYETTAVQPLLDITGEARKTSYVMFSYGPLHRDVPVLANQQELTYNSYVWTQDVVWEISQKQWIIGTNVWESQGNLCKQHNMMMIIYIYIYIYYHPI